MSLRKFLFALAIVLVGVGIAVGFWRVSVANPAPPPTACGSVFERVAAPDDAGWVSAGRHGLRPSEQCTSSLRTRTWATWEFIGVGAVLAGGAVLYRRQRSRH